MINISNLRKRVVLLLIVGPRALPLAERIGKCALNEARYSQYSDTFDDSE